MKEARRKIHTCLEVLLSRNAELEGHGEEAVPFLDAELRREFPLFLKYLNSQQPIFSDTGRLHNIIVVVVVVVCEVSCTMHL